MGNFFKILNNCDEASFLALKSKEEELALKQKLWLQLHIFFCKCCKNFTKQSSQIDVSLKEYFKRLDKEQNVKASEEFKARMKNQFK